MSTAADAKNFLRQFRAFIKFAESLADVEDFEIDLGGLRQTKEDLAREMSEASEELEGIRHAIKKSEEHLGELEKKAAEITADAEQQAKEILERARDQALAARMAANEANSKELETVKKQVKDLQSDLARLDKEKAQAVIEKSNLETAINDLKKKFL